MQAVILAGGFGTRMSEETVSKPKPMVEVGGRPLLWHILKMYSYYGVNDFIICLGYKGYVIKEYFFNYFNHVSDLEVNLQTGEHKILGSNTEPWKVKLIDTGPESMTGGRLRRVKEHINSTFCFTYGDGLSDINIKDEIEFHKSQNRLATVAAVQPPGRFGVLDIDHSNMVRSFQEKPQDEVGWINGGFFILEPEAIDYIDGDHTSWEKEPLQRLAADNQLSAYHHKGFWKPCDMLRDKNELEKLWASGQAPWKAWA